jgi:hypothetical protein
MGGSNTTISTVQPMAGNLRIQTAVYGSVIPLVYGRTRISGNLIWYGGFKAVPHTSSQTSGGKGGGGGITQTNTTYTYTAALMMSLGEGIMNGVVSAWKGKARFAGVPAGTSLVTNVSAATVPAGRTVTIPNFAGNVSVVDNRPEYYDSYDYGGNG